jgi:hypothetical protein
VGPPPDPPGRIPAACPEPFRPGNPCASGKWKCPEQECPATEFAPSYVTTFESEVSEAMCNGACGQVYPASWFERA